MRGTLATAALAALATTQAFAADAFDPATAFGARPSIQHMSLSPDGKSVAYVGATTGQTSALFTADVVAPDKPQIALKASGNPERLGDCHWVSNRRIVCTVYGVVKSDVGIVPFTRLVAVDRAGGNLQLLSTRTNDYSRGLHLGGGEVIDWLPDEDGAVLVTRMRLPDDHIGSRLGSSAEGMAVDRLDTRTLDKRMVEPPVANVDEYIADGRGHVRVMGRWQSEGVGYATGKIRWSYRRTGSREWENLADYDMNDRSGFLPLVVDPERDAAIGFKKKDGRVAVYAVSLDGRFTETELFAHPQVDVDDLIRIGRRGRVVGASYVTDRREAFYFDPQIEKLRASLARALPNGPKVRIVDSSVDEQVLLILAGSDDDAGIYYLFDRQAKKLQTFLVVRSELEGVKLAKQRAISYAATDGTQIPAYLTLPPGRQDAKGLPAIVMPHGGPSARDEWGFDWLAQYYAARGYAVLQPNFRGSEGYGDDWLVQNGFRGWRTAIGDVLDAGRWLMKEVGTKPEQLAIVGWSYGGYAALQSAATDSGVFKAVVAIAPVTDLRALVEESRDWANFRIVKNFVGDGAQLREASPSENAAQIKVPVLLFHGTLDRNTRITQSQLMAKRLAAAGAKHEMVTFEGLDHYLEDSASRARLLRQSDEFLRRALGLPR